MALRYLEENFATMLNRDRDTPPFKDPQNSQFGISPDANATGAGVDTHAWSPFDDPAEALQAASPTQALREAQTPPEAHGHLRGTAQRIREKNAQIRAMKREPE